jgi:hypothetical protein
LAKQRVVEPDAITGKQAPNVSRMPLSIDANDRRKARHQRRIGTIQPDPYAEIVVARKQWAGCTGTELLNIPAYGADGLNAPGEDLATIGWQCYICRRADANL